ncbi:MAG: hypothetical protein BGP03_20925 [Pseudonocardia sp. 73-21]|nr:MAG: hypothetical protein BGP03_20925 [Pseudonocardia sp. 73-21]
MDVRRRDAATSSSTPTAAAVAPVPATSTASTRTSSEVGTPTHPTTDAGTRPSRRRASSAARPTVATAHTGDSDRTTISERPNSSTTCSSRS